MSVFKDQSPIRALLSKGHISTRSLLWGKSYSLIKYIGDSYDPTLTSCVCRALFNEHVLYGKLQPELV